MAGHDIIFEHETRAKRTGIVADRGQRFAGRGPAESEQFIRENLDRIGEVIEIVACSDGKVDIVGTKGTLRPEGFRAETSRPVPRRLIQVLDDLGLVNDDNMDQVIDGLRNLVACDVKCCHVLYRKQP